MAKQAKPKRKSRAKASRPSVRKLALRWGVRGVLGLAAVMVVVIALHSIVRPWAGSYMASERHRLGKIDRTWVPMREIAPVMARSAVAAEDSNFCLHWGFDMNAIRHAIDGGARRGGSTISQQVVKNVYLWHGRNYVRKALETMITPVVELLWSKRRILEVYLNVAEFDEGVFGIEAAAWHYFGVAPKDLSPDQSARLAAILPAPQDRSASRPSDFVLRRAAAIRDGAATIRKDGRAACFED
ncbi:monofunctional biosynthetic peptidoglycan transglycosylase [Pseudooceanicola spongiae]|uniref:Biosynthetic peptidoglycan transglycosylase n=1 Tax=Pseudooceanicola spongiae TaxID=2613965 RepID=A0A7L9WPB0_9RHOB|nr:monofunctional biosynthetic peptidoglycan transglycosylase [Pseudooceanicola spongiae]QOL82141.1 monofunctional biosynthetic peptidoglycan transglycosylase [Pseudooceanicola spongiae]